MVMSGKIDSNVPGKEQTQQRNKNYMKEALRHICASIITRAKMPQKSNPGDRPY